MKKFMVTVGSFIILLFLGLIYAWSIFASPLEAEFGWSRAQTSLTFTISIAAFCIGGIVVSQLRKKLNLQVILLINAFLILIGFFLTSNLNSIWELYLYYGVICGFAVGASYNCVISTIPLHYPTKVGSISGIMLLAFGVGGYTLGKVADVLIISYNWRDAFLYIGIAFFVVYLLFLFFIKPPKVEKADVDATSEVSKSDNSYTLGRMVKHPYFWSFFIWQTFVNAMGLSLIGQAKQIADEVTVAHEDVLIAVLITTVCSGLGKMLFGFIYDIKGRYFSLTLAALIGFVGATLAFISTFAHMPLLFFVALFFGGIAYGSGPACNAAFTRKQFGNAHFSTNFAVNTLALLVAAFVGNLLVGVLQKTTASYVLPLGILIGYMAIALIASQFLKKEKI